MSRRATGVFIVLALGISVSAGTSQDRPPRPPENVKVLTELQVPAIRGEMQRIADALGVKCDHCHVQGNFASDEKSPKRTARRMLEMTRGLNVQYFPKHEVKEGESMLGRVTCATCHQGGTSPK